MLVHDAARALTPTRVFDQVAARLAAGDQAVIPVLPVIDTIARVDVDGAVLGNVDRADLRRVQTPQGFDRELLRRAHEARPGDLEATDDASLVSRLGVRVQAIPGDPLAMKVTTPKTSSWPRRC